MTCKMSNKFIETLSKMTDKQIIEYSEKFLGMEGRELVFELAQRLRQKKAEIYHLSGKLNSAADYSSTLDDGEIIEPDSDGVSGD